MKHPKFVMHARVCVGWPSFLYPNLGRYLWQPKPQVQQLYPNLRVRLVCFCRKQ